MNNAILAELAQGWDEAMSVSLSLTALEPLENPAIPVGLTDVP